MRKLKLILNRVNEPTNLTATNYFKGISIKDRPYHNLVNEMYQQAPINPKVKIDSTYDLLMRTIPIVNEVHPNKSKLRSYLAKYRAFNNEQTLREFCDKLDVLDGIQEPQQVINRWNLRDGYFKNLTIEDMEFDLLNSDLFETPSIQHFNNSNTPYWDDPIDFIKHLRNIRRGSPYTIGESPSMMHARAISKNEFNEFNSNRDFNKKHARNEKGHKRRRRQYTHPSRPPPIEKGGITTYLHTPPGEVPGITYYSNDGKHQNFRNAMGWSVPSFGGMKYGFGSAETN